MNISSRKWHQLKFATSWLILKPAWCPMFLCIAREPRRKVFLVWQVISFMEIENKKPSGREV
jgi:hypothetical protein